MAVKGHSVCGGNQLKTHDIQNRNYFDLIVLSSICFLRDIHIKVIHNFIYDKSITFSFYIIGLI